MADLKHYQGDMNAADMKIGIIVSRFNSFIVEHLLSGAVDALVRHGADRKDIQVVYVPGAFEIALMAQTLAATQRYDGVIALGAVIRGATPHFDYVAGECAKGIGQVSLQYSIPIGFGVLTVDTIEQAVERAGTKAGNKGVDAALSVVEMVNVVRQVGKKQGVI